MLNSCAMLPFLLLFSASAFAQEIGVVQCNPGAAAQVSAFIAPGKPFVIAQLACGQTVRVLGIDKSFSPLSYSSRPAEYIIIQLDKNLAYVDPQFIRLLKPGEKPEATPVEKPAPPKEITLEEKEQQKWDRIPKDSIKIREEILSRPIILNGSIYMRTFRAVLTNTSAFPISRLNLLVRIYDCAGKAKSDYSNCEIVGEAKSEAAASVPAGQTRPLEVLATFDAIPQVRGTMGWSYQILGVRTE